MQVENKVLNSEEVERFVQENTLLIRKKQLKAKKIG